MFWSFIYTARDAALDDGRPRGGLAFGVLDPLLAASVLLSAPSVLAPSVLAPSVLARSVVLSEFSEVSDGVMLTMELFALRDDGEREEEVDARVDLNLCECECFVAGLGISELARRCSRLVTRRFMLRSSCTMSAMRSATLRPLFVMSTLLRT